MHPILGQTRQLGLYLLAWVPIAVILWYMLMSPGELTAGEALVMADERNPMPDEAATAFEKAVALDPKDPRARYFLAVKKDLTKDHQGALNDWLALLKETPPGAPWESDLRRTITQSAKINSIDVSAQLAAIKPAAPHPDGAGARSRRCC